MTPDHRSVPARPFRVLFVNDTSRNGGPGRSLLALLQNLDPRAFHRAVLLPRPGEISELLTRAKAADELLFAPDWVEHIAEPWTRPVARADLDAPVAVRALRAAGNVPRMARAMWKLAALTRRGSYDLVYANGTIADFVTGLLGTALKVPVFWHVRYTSVPSALVGLHRFLARSVVRRIVCVSGASAALFGEIPHKVAVVHNGVDLGSFVPSAQAGAQLRRELNLSPDTVLFGSHGRILRKKGFVEMLGAARMALDELSETERARCHFVVVGDTPQDFKPDHLEECRALAGRLGLSRHVSFLGFRSDVRSVIAGVDVGVVPSIYPDPLPRAVLECMAMAKPVLAFDVGGVKEMLGADEGSLLAGDPADVVGLAQAFTRYFRDPALRQRQGAAARARVLKDFDARTHAARISAEIAVALTPSRLPAARLAG